MIPISILLIFFLFYMALVLLFTFFNTYHMLRFGEARMKTIVITVVYLACVAAILVWSAILIVKADWSITLNVIPQFKILP